MDYKLLGIDLDGTLVDQNQKISQKNLKDVINFIHMDGYPVILTGRSWERAKKYVEQINENSPTKMRYFVGFNGAYIRNLQTDEIEEKLISHDLVSKIWEYCENHGLQMWAYTKLAVAKNSIQTNCIEFNNFANFFGQFSFSQLTNLSNLESYKINIYSLNKTRLDDAEKFINFYKNEHLKTFRINNNFLEVVSCETDKGIALESIAKKLRVKLFSTACIGNSANDLPMFQKTELKFAIATQNKELKALANETINCKKYAVSKIIRKNMFVNHSDIQMVLSDVDGTLLDNITKLIYPETALAIRKSVQLLGINLCFATGRSVEDCLLISKNLGLNENDPIYIAANNGAVIYDVRKNKYIYDAPIQKDDIDKIIHAINTALEDPDMFGNISALLYTFNKSSNPIHNMILNKKQKIFVMNQEHFKKTLKKSSNMFFTNNWANNDFIELNQNTQSELPPVTKFVIYLDNEEYHQRMMTLLSSIGLDCEFTASGKKTIEVNALYVNKGYALQRLCRYLNIKPEQTMPIGDNDNDISMLELSPYSCTLMKAEPQVKSASHYIFKTPESKFIADAIQHFILNK